MISAHLKNYHTRNVITEKRWVLRSLTREQASVHALAFVMIASKPTGSEPIGGGGAVCLFSPLSTRRSKRCWWWPTVRPITAGTNWQTVVGVKSEINRQKKNWWRGFSSICTDSSSECLPCRRFLDIQATWSLTLHKATKRGTECAIVVNPSPTSPFSRWPLAQRAISVLLT